MPVLILHSSKDPNSSLCFRKEINLSQGIVRTCSELKGRDNKGGDNLQGEVCTAEFPLPTKHSLPLGVLSCLEIGIFGCFVVVFLPLFSTSEKSMSKCDCSVTFTRLDCFSSKILQWEGSLLFLCSCSWDALSCPLRKPKSKSLCFLLVKNVFLS